MRSNYDFSNGVRGKYTKRLPHSLFKSGEQNPRAKADWALVDYVRENYKPFERTAKMLCKETGLTVHCIRKILNGKHWVGGKFPKVRSGQYRKLTFAQAQEVRQLHELGYGYKKLGRMFGLNPYGTIRRIIRWEIYKEEKKGGAAL